jgi:hypothetical protein
VVDDDREGFGVIHEAWGDRGEPFGNACYKLEAVIMAICSDKNVSTGMVSDCSDLNVRAPVRDVVFK